MSKINYYKFIFFTNIFAIVLLSVYPGSLLGLIFLGNDDVLPGSDKSHHFIAYFITTIFGLLAYSKKNIFLLLSFSLLILGSILEIIQIWIPNRSFELLDMLSNTSGVVIGLSVIQIFDKIKITKK